MKSAISTIVNCKIHLNHSPLFRRSIFHPTKPISRPPPCLIRTTTSLTKNNSSFAPTIMASSFKPEHARAPPALPLPAPPLTKFKIWLCQLSVTADKERNIAHARKAIEEAVEKSAKHVLLPVEDKCNTTLENISSMVDKLKKVSGKGVSPSINLKSVIFYEKPPPIVPKRRPKKTDALKSPYTYTQVFKPKKLPKFKPFPKLPQTELKKFDKMLYTYPCVLLIRLGSKPSIRLKNGLWFEDDKLFEYAIGASPCFANPWIGVDK
ncbi:hypothetical protein Ddye_020180, partial [Dipteronia dyeriana]